MPWTRPVVEGLTIWRSSDWDEWLDLFTPGERALTKEWKPPGPPLRMPLGRPGQCGAPELWRGELAWPPVALPVDPATGVAPCCGPQLVPDEWGIVYGFDDDLVTQLDQEAGYVVGAGDSVGLVDDGGPVFGAGDVVGLVDDAGFVLGADDVVGLVDDAGFVLGADDQVIPPVVIPEYWGILPTPGFGGCVDEMPPYLGWHVAGEDGGAPTDHVLPQGDTLLFTPLVNARSRNIVEARIQCGEIHAGDGAPLARFAIYHSRGDRCGYPGNLYWDGGEIDLMAHQSVPIPGLAGVGLPPGELLWLASWWAGGTDVRHIGHAGVADAAAWPVLGFFHVTELVPFIGWSVGKVYKRPFEEAWPATIGDLAQPITVDGVDRATATFIGLPAVWLLLQTP